MPWGYEAEIDGFEFGGFGGWNSSCITRNDGIILNKNHIELLENPIFLKVLKKAILGHWEKASFEIEEYLLEWGKRQAWKPSLKTIRAKVWLRDQKTCRYCKKEIDLNESVSDHVFPKSRGGSNELYNLVCSCVTCNQKKGARTPKEAGMKLLLLEMVSNEEEQQHG